MRSLQMARRVIAAAAMTLCLTAVAQAQQPGRIRGEIEKADGGTLAVKTRDGAVLTVKVDANTRVSALEKASLADIRTDTFIGIAGMPRPDGAIETHPREAGPTSSSRSNS